MAEADRPAALAMRDVVDHVRAAAQSKTFDTDYELRRAMAEAGAVVWPERIRIGGRLQHMLVNHAAEAAARRAAEEDAAVNADEERAQAAAREALRKLLVRPAELLQVRM